VVGKEGGTRARGGDGREEQRGEKRRERRSWDSGGGEDSKGAGKAGKNKRKEQEHKKHGKGYRKGAQGQIRSLVSMRTRERGEKGRE
jgi:hypothetical protein